VPALDLARSSLAAATRRRPVALLAGLDAIDQQWDGLGLDRQQALINMSARPPAPCCHRLSGGSGTGPRHTPEAWFTDHPGLGLVCGAVSGQLEMLELERGALAEGLLEQLTKAVNAAGLGPVLERIVYGYTERTPSDGLHLVRRATKAGLLKAFFTASLTMASTWKRATG
jgi:hypothetical protein